MNRPGRGQRTFGIGATHESCTTALLLIKGRACMRFLAGLLTVSCTLAATDTAHAQNRRFGAKGGITLASADIEDISGTFDAENRTGWGAGVFLTLGGGRFSIQPELNFV